MQNFPTIIAVLSVGLGLFLLKRFTSGTNCPLSWDLTGHTAVITGGNTGIGYETALALCQMGCRVIIGARDQQKSQRAVSAISKTANGRVTAFKLDLSDKQSISNFANNVKKQLDGSPVNYLINNAAVILLPERKLTKQGLEMHIGVNHFGHFYLTYLLWPMLKSAGNPRIINVSSNPYQKQVPKFHLNLDDINIQHSEYTPLGAYGRTKKANVLFTRQLQKRINQAHSNAMTFSIHPGFVNSQASRQVINSPIRKFLFALIQPVLFFAMKTPKQGAQSILYAILEREDKLEKGQLYTQCRVYHFKTEMYTSQLLMKRLWEMSEEVFGVKFVI